MEDILHKAPTKEALIEVYKQLYPSLPLHFRVIGHNNENITVRDYSEIPSLLEDNRTNDIYIVLNPAVSDTVHDKDISELRYLLIDFDIYFKEKRQPTIQEYIDCVSLGLKTLGKLKELGYSAHAIPTGNGLHLYLHVNHKIQNELDLANTSNVCKMFLNWLNLTFTPNREEGKAFIDTINYNPSRIARAPYSRNNKYGIKNAREAYVQYVEDYTPCTLSDLTYFTGEPSSLPTDISIIPDNDLLELVKFIDLRSDKLKLDLPRQMNYPFHTKWDVEECAFSVNGDKHYKDASILLRVDGYFVYKCFHQSCQSEHSTFEAYLEKHGVSFNPNHILEEKYRYVKAKNDSYLEGKPDTPLTVRLKEEEPKNLNLPSFGDYNYDRRTGKLAFSVYESNINLMSRHIPENDLNFKDKRAEVFENSHGFCSAISVYNTMDANNISALYTHFFNNINNNTFVGIDTMYSYDVINQIWVSSSEDVRKSVKSKLSSFLDDTAEYISHLIKYFSEVEEKYFSILTPDETRFVTKILQELGIGYKSVATFKNSTNKLKLLETKVLGKFDEDYSRAVSASMEIAKPIDTENTDYKEYTEKRFGLDYSSTRSDNLIPTPNGFKIYNTTLSRRYIVFDNGVFDWNSLQLIENKKELLAITRVRREYIPPTQDRPDEYTERVEKQTRWQQYLDDLLEPEKQQLVQHRYAAMANPLEKCCHAKNRLMVFWGKAGAGKSMFPTLMLQIFCESDIAMASTIFKKQDSREFDNGVYRTIGSRLVPIQEFDITPQTIDTRLFKTLFDENTVTIRPNYKQSMTVRLIAGFIGTSNTPPAISEFKSGDAEAIERRMTVIEVKPRPVGRKNINKYQEVLYNECFDAIMDWVIEGMMHIRQFGEVELVQKEAQSKSPVEELILSLQPSEGHLLTSEEMYRSLKTNMSKSSFDAEFAKHEELIYDNFGDVVFIKERGKSSHSLLNLKLPSQPSLNPSKDTVDKLKIEKYT